MSSTAGRERREAAARWWAASLLLVVAGAAVSAHLLTRALALLTSPNPASWFLGVPIAGWGLVFFTALGALLLLARFLREAFAAEALLAVLPQHVGDLVFRGAGQPFGGALAAFRVHAHVERTVVAEAEAAFGDVELRRGHAQVEEHAVEPVGGVLPIGELGEAASDGPVHHGEGVGPGPGGVRDDVVEERHGRAVAQPQVVPAGASPTR